MMMISSHYIKGALLVALVTLFTVHALAAEENSGKPVDGTAIIHDVQTEDTVSPPSTLSPSAEPDDKNNTTPSTTTTTTTTTSAPPPVPDTNTTSTTTTTTTTEKPTTTSVAPDTTTSTTTTVPTTPTPAPNSTTSAPPTSTTPAPTPVPHCNRFDVFSLIGGMILAYGLLAIGLVLFKVYKTTLNSNVNNTPSYRTL